MAYISQEEKHLYLILQTLNHSFVQNAIVRRGEDQGLCYSAMILISKKEKDLFNILLIHVEEKLKSKSEMDIKQHNDALKKYLENAKTLNYFFLGLSYEDKDNMEIIVKEMLKGIDKGTEEKYRVSTPRLANAYGLGENSIITTGAIITATKKLTQKEKRQICIDVDDDSPLDDKKTTHSSSDVPSTTNTQDQGYKYCIVM